LTSYPIYCNNGIITINYIVKNGGLYMNVAYSTIIFTIINFVLLFAIIIAIYKGIQTVKIFVNRNKRMDEKLDIIINKLENKEVKQDN